MSPDQGPHQQSSDSEVVIVGPDGNPVGQFTLPPDGGRPDGQEERNPAELVEQPAKVMRIGSMVKQLLEEVRAAPLDDAARDRLREIHTSSIRELSTGLSPELREELARLSLPFGSHETPSDAELRVAQAQLVGWLEGLFHGIQTALFAQQVATRMQVERAGGRPAIGGPPGPGAPGGPGTPGSTLGPTSGTGQYL